MNGHFAAVGLSPTADDFGHGIQVIDENKAFTCVTTASRAQTYSNATDMYFPSSAVNI